ncbi:MAG: c-type cytochrome biogenesis protein CcmI, partial [Pseudomonadota bacterium]
MIWVIFFILLLVTGAYLVFPFLQAAPKAAPDALEEAKQQRATVDLDEAAGRLSADAAIEARDALDRRILDLLDAPKTFASERRLKSAVVAIVPAVLLLGGVGVYTQVGSPGLEPISFADYQAQQAAALPDTLEGLVVQLKDRLEADPNPPADGYVLLARSYL